MMKFPKQQEASKPYLGKKVIQDFSVKLEFEIYKLEFLVISLLICTCFHFFVQLFQIFTIGFSFS